MPRKAREKVPYGTYYITQSCVSEKSLFDREVQRERFIAILRDKKQQFNFKLYGFCLRDPKRYRLILYDNGSDISKIMKSINISLAAGERIFSERYKSQLIHSAQELDQLLRQLHETEDCCSTLVSLCEELIDRDLYFTPPDSHTEHVVIRDKDTDEVCMQISADCQDTSRCIRNVTQGQAVIQEMARRQGLSPQELIADRALRNQALMQFRRMTTLSMKEIGALFGGLSESAVCKIISRNKKRGE